MTMNSSTPSNKRICQPLNVYNIYFILERQRLFQEMKGSGETAAVQHDHEELPRDLAGYDFLSLPDFPPRYQELQLPHGWFVPGKNSKRKHVRSHGLSSFAELARSVALGWKNVDSETKDYCITVASILKKRHSELLKVSPRPMKKTKPQTANNMAKDSEPTKASGMWCLPTMEHRFIEMPRPMPPGPIQKWTQKVPPVLPSPGHVSAEMCQRMPPDLVQYNDRKTLVPIMTGSDSYNGFQFPIITNIDRRASISNMMMGTRTFLEQPIFQVNSPSFFGERGWPQAREHAASAQEKNLAAIYKAQALDIPDSDVMGMWESSEVHEGDIS